MIHPSYSELIQAINTNSEEDDNTILLNSRYSLVLATSKRARQIIGGSEPMVGGAAGKKPFSVAIDEFYKGKVKIIAKALEEEATDKKGSEPEVSGSEVSEPEVSESEVQKAAQENDTAAQEAAGVVAETAEDAQDPVQATETVSAEEE